MRDTACGQNQRKITKELLCLKHLEIDNRKFSLLAGLNFNQYGKLEKKFSQCSFTRTTKGWPASVSKLKLVQCQSTLRANKTIQGKGNNCHCREFTIIKQIKF